MLQELPVNTKAILDLAHFFETLDPKLYRQDCWDDCEGARCICGWTNYRAGYSPAHDQETAAILLGIDEEMATKLFRGSAGRKTKMGYFGLRDELPTPQEAASCLRHLAITGEVPKNW
jgi:hypothetical protein